MTLRVPKVNGPAADEVTVAPAGVTGPRVPEQPLEMRAARTVHLRKLLEATKDLPPAERAKVQMQFLAYPQSWAADQWLDVPSDR